MELLKGTTAEVPSQGITFLPIKQAGMKVPNPTLSTRENWTAYFFVTGHLVAALHRRTDFKTRYYSMILQ